MKLHDIHVSRVLKVQSPTTTFEEWKAAATVNAPQNVKENFAPMSIPGVGGYPGIGHRKRYSISSSVGSGTSAGESLLLPYLCWKFIF